jgi:protein gp37
MADQTAIEWCDSTFNPWIGCTRVSPACDDCYAARSTPARTLGVAWGPGEARRRTADSTWALPKKWNAQRFVQCASCGWRGELRNFKGATGWTMCPACSGADWHGTRRRVFCASLADWLDNEVLDTLLAELLDLIRNTPDLQWLLLTKRIGNWRQRLTDALAWAAIEPGRRTWPGLAEWITAWLDGNAPQQVWIGATVVNQAETDRDVPKLLQVPARVRFLSVEPMLGPVEALQWLRSDCWHGSRPGPGGRGGVTCMDCNGNGHQCKDLHWVICGGESGPKARPMHPDWARSLRDQCSAAEVPFLFKQWGEWCEHDDSGLPGVRTALDGDPEFHSQAAKCDAFMAFDGELVTDLDAFRDDVPYRGMVRIGKKAAGRQLDGRTHDGFPK